MGVRFELLVIAFEHILIRHGNGDAMNSEFGRDYCSGH